MNTKIKSCVFLFLIGTLSLTGCGSPLEAHLSQKRSAPKDAADLGVVVSGADEKEIASLLDAHPEAQFRSLNKNDGLYEIFGLDLTTVRAEVKGRVGPNLWIPSAHPPSDFEAHLWATPSNLKSTTGDGMRLSRCLKDSSAPTSVLKILEPLNGLPPRTPVEMGTEIELSGTATPHPRYPGDVKTAFAVLTPEGNTEPEIVSFGNDLKFKADAMGIYQVVFIAQDSRDVCTMKQLYVFVSGNRPFAGVAPDIDHELASLKLTDFDQLQRVKAEEAWKIGQGEGRVIAVVDSGVNYNHPALVKNILVNEKEIPDNGIDDDANGFVDDYVGYDFANDDAFPFDDEGHGSHVSGLAASSVFGIAKQAKILPVKAIGLVGGDMASVAAGIRYAVDRGANVINLSVGNYGVILPEVARAIDYAESKGVLAVAASGNGNPFLGVGLDTDKTPNYPSALPNDNIIAVAASAKNLPLAPYSNYGVKTVDLVAPGGNNPDDMLKSCFLYNPQHMDYTGMSGTSMASPITAGAAALVWGLRPEFTPAQVRQVLMESGDAVKGLEKYIQSGRALNVEAAAKMALTVSF
jgi:subtilisin family serine protease